MNRIPGLYLRGETWWFTWRHVGKKFFVSLKTSDEAQAVRLAGKVRKAVGPDRRGLLADERARFLAHKKASGVYSRHSAEWAETPLKNLETFFGNVSPAAVTTTQLEKFAQSLRERLSEASAASYMRAVRSFFSWLEKRRQIIENPASGLRLPKLTQRARVEFCTREQRDKLIAEAKDADLKLILMLGFHAGLRKNEIVEARPGWVDLDRGAIHIEQTETFRAKDRDSRSIPLTSALRDHLKTCSLDGPFIVKPAVVSGAAIYRYDFRLPFKLHVIACELPWVTPHTMRRTFASLLVSAGVSIYKVAKWLGDSVAVTERHYGHLIVADTDIERSH